MALAVKASSKKVDLDVRAENVAPETMGLLMSEALSVKGFCVLNPDIDENRLQSVQSDISSIDQDGGFSQPPEALLEGLLSMAGSARIAELDLPEGDDSDSPSVRYFDKLMTDLSLAVAPYLPALQIEVKARTSGILHEAGMPAGQGPDLDEETCAKWVSVFAHHMIMCIVALGPGQGTLELQPFDDESNGYSVPMNPGSVVLLRADALSHRFSAAGKAYCLTCWLQKDGRGSKHRDNTKMEITPCCKALEEWAENKIEEYKSSFPEEQERMNALPRHWQSVMNHTSFVGQHMVVRTASIKQVGSYDVGAFASSFTNGVDYCQEIPLQRFNVDQHWDPHPEAWNWHKINVRHGSFIEGVELFDNSLFRISRAEAAGMDPGHRMTLETGYEALIRDGYKISTIMNSRGGVYIANPPPSEWGMTEKDCVSSGVCGGGGSIACGRFSFVHGLKGPCISVDVESASSLVAVNYCCINLSWTGKWEPIPYGVLSSWSLILHPLFLVHASAGGRTSPVGRTFCFDASASGYTRGECAISLVLKAGTSKVDEQIVVNEGNWIGSLAASAVNQSGRRASITAPDCAAIQEVIYEAVKQAEISPLDVEAVECASEAAVIHDALEVSAVAKALRPQADTQPDTCPVSLVCCKSNFGNQCEAGGFTTLLRVLVGAHWGTAFPGVHLRLLNPHIDIEVCDRPAYIAAESVEYSLSSTYIGLTNRSYAGTNCHCICWGQISDYNVSMFPEPAFKREKIIFWPEGGGALDEDQVPKRGYQIIGSWNRWEAENMESESGGVYSATFVMGENRWERFQILLDGDGRKVLYPSWDRADQSTKGAPVAGPTDVFHSDSWLVDTRLYMKDEGAIVPAGSTSVLDCQDVGKPGDRFRVRLSVKGKWRLVEWENLDKDAPQAASTPPSGSYAVSGSWNHGELQNMTADPSTPGLYTAEVKLVNKGSSFFQIIRNGDWDQAIYPDEPGASSSADIIGPDEQIGYAWAIQGDRGDVFQISFQRSTEGGSETKKVSWERVRTDELNKEEYDESRRPQYFVRGTWDDMNGLHRMHWTGEYYQFYVQLGSNERESFHIYLDGSRYKAIYPGTADATPFEKHELMGPDSLSAGLMWTMGIHQSDDAAPGKRYEVRLRVSEEDLRKPEKVDWMPVRGITGLEDAKGRGFLVIGS